MRNTLVVLLLLATPVKAEDLAAGLKKCATVRDSLQRLVCYDNLTKRADGVTTDAATQPQPAVSNYNAAPTKPGYQATSSRCQAATKRGTQCSRKAKPGSSYCWQHGG